MYRKDIEEYKIKSSIKRAVESLEKYTNGNPKLLDHIVKESPYLDSRTILLTDREFNEDYTVFTRDINHHNVGIILEEIIKNNAKDGQILIVPVGLEVMLGAYYYNIKD